jgi:CRISPR/Cas system CSM-associated protein Csm3 (group 7 of RAMP superfamily)
MRPHNRLVNRSEFHGAILMETALHVGTGQTSTIADNGVIRDFQDHPFIPGSSLKGALRSGVDRRAGWLGLRSCCLDTHPLASINSSSQDDLNNNTIPADLRRAVEAGGVQLPENATVSVEERDNTWFIADAESQQTYAVRNIKGRLNVYDRNDNDCLTVNGRTEERVNGTPWREHDLQWRLREMQSGLCDVCKVFGSTVFGGKVQVDDLPLGEPFDSLADSLLEVRDGVGIDRDSGTAVDYIKFDYEVVPSLTTFRFYLTVENLEAAEAALLALGLLEMMNGTVPLGGKTTRGLGRCRLHLQEVFHFEFPQNEPLESGLLLEYLKPPHQRTQGREQAPRTFLETQIRSFLSND